MASPVLDQFLPVNGIQMHYLDAGASDAPALLMVHGLTREAHSFDPAIGLLGPHYRCLVPDMRGRGRSERGAPETYHIGQYVDDVLAFLDLLGLERVHYLGTSMGGLIAMSLAARDPGRFERLALNDIGPEVAQGGSERIQGHLSNIPERFASYEDALAYEINRFPWLAQRDREEVDAQYRHMIVREEDGSCRFHYDPRISLGRANTPAARQAQRELCWQGFRALDCPLLLIRGAETDLLSRETVAEMRAAQPALTVAEVPGVGHAPTLAEPAAQTALSAFFNGG